MKRQKTIMRAVASARHAWNNHVRQITLEEGIPDSYRPVLLHLYHEPGKSQKNLAEFAKVTTSAINQTVKNMLEEGYIRKETDTSDRRNTRLYLTEKGEEASARLRARLDMSDDAITAFIGEEEEKGLMKILDSLSEFIRRELGQC